jgi:hypothetical protein
MELHTFLLAEALDVIQGGGAGMREITHRHAEIGAAPLIALGMAERMARNRQPETAVPLFEKALAGDLMGLRNRGRVAHAAADAALQVGQFELVEGFLEEAMKVPETRGLVERRRRELVALDDDPIVARPALEELVMQSTGLTRARFLQRLAKLVAAEDFDAAVTRYEEAMALARRDRALAEKIRADLVELLEAHAHLEPLEEEREARMDAAPDSDAEPADADAQDIDDHAEAAPDDEEPPSGADTAAENVGGKVAPPPLPAHPESTTRSTPASAKSAEADAPASNHPASAAPPSSISQGDRPALIAEPAATSSATGPRSKLSTRSPLGSLAPAARPLFANIHEEALFAELVGGRAEAGDELVACFDDAAVGSRIHDVLVVRRHQAALRPGHRGTLERLRAAAIADRDEVYARAIEHVLECGSGSAPVAPPLTVQQHQPELVTALLLRDTMTRELEVLSLVWECGMFRRDLASYGLTAADRVPHGTPSVVAETYAVVAGHLGTPRPLFHRRGAEPFGASVLLFAQPAILVSGDATERSPELTYTLACAHASSQPLLLLAASLPDATLRRLFEAVIAAFGPVAPRGGDTPPPSSSGSFRTDVAKIGAELWQLVTPRVDRRLREICEAGAFDLSAARAAARRAMRRAGLFASGDLATAIRITVRELGDEDELDLSDPQALERSATTHPEVADLVRLASRLEFAEARWQPPPPSSIRR